MPTRGEVLIEKVGNFRGWLSGLLNNGEMISSLDVLVESTPAEASAWILETLVPFYPMLCTPETEADEIKQEKFYALAVQRYGGNDAIGMVGPEHMDKFFRYLRCFCELVDPELRAA